MYPLNGRVCPNFNAAAVDAKGNINNIDFHQAIDGQYAVLFFYPLNFTFVCPTEVMALNRKIQAFRDANVAVFTVSIDSAFSHAQWRNLTPEQGGIGPVDFTMIADNSHNITRSYGVEHPEENVAFRATFIIDDEKQIWSQTINNLPIGRNIDDILRTVQAIQHFKAHGEVCPANWQQGAQAMQATAQGVAEYLTQQQAATENSAS